MANALTLYQTTTRLGSPLIRAYLKLRQLRGKEDPARITERFGRASIPRPEGRLWWLHAASVGEAVSLKPLIEKIHQTAPDIHLLLTSGTVSSANLLADTLPDYVMHQFIPVDTPSACQKFLDHWQPELGVFTESELWPNLMIESQKRRVNLALINARMSKKSFEHWQILAKMAKSLLASFSLIAAQSTKDAERYTKLGADSVKQFGHLKQDADELIADETVVARWKDAIKDRPCLVAASFHPDEDEVLAELHESLKKDIPKLLTILVPRHPPRGAGMAQSFKAVRLKPTLRSDDAGPPGEEIDCYIADTIGELGLWYRLADVVMMGGSFTPHGGQNPLEAIRLNKAVMIGPHTHNFQTIVDELKQAGGIKQLDSEQLLETTKQLLTSESERNSLIKNASAWLANSPPVAQKLTEALVDITKEAA